MTETLGDGPIQPDLIVVMNRIAHSLDNILNGEERPKRNGFVLLIFPFDGREGRANYISNAERADVMTLLKEQIVRFEAQDANTGRD